jgi:hypothetical protein
VPRSGRCRVGRQAQAIVVAAMGVDETAIRIIEVEVAGQLLRAQFSGEAAIAVSLLFDRETDGHEPPPFEGCFAKLQKFCERTGSTRLPQKLGLMQELLQGKERRER